MRTIVRTSRDYYSPDRYLVTVECPNTDLNYTIEVSTFIAKTSGLETKLVPGECRVKYFDTMEDFLNFLPKNKLKEEIVGVLYLHGKITKQSYYEEVK